MQPGRSADAAALLRLFSPAGPLLAAMADADAERAVSFWLSRGGEVERARAVFPSACTAGACVGPGPAGAATPHAHRMRVSRAIIGLHHNHSPNPTLPGPLLLPARPPARPHPAPASVRTGTSRTGELATVCGAPRRAVRGRGRRRRALRRRRAVHGHHHRRQCRARHPTRRGRLPGRVGLLLSLAGLLCRVGQRREWREWGW